MEKVENESKLNNSIKFKSDYDDKKNKLISSKIISVESIGALEKIIERVTMAIYEHEFKGIGWKKDILLGTGNLIQINIRFGI